MEEKRTLKVGFGTVALGEPNVPDSPNVPMPEETPMDVFDVHEK